MQPARAFPSPRIHWRNRRRVRRRTSGRSFVYNLRLPGQYYDAETGLSYNYFRDYDPATGRYVESDPIGLDGGISSYAYVANNPLQWLDPMGLISIPDIPGAEGETSENANPGPGVTDYRAEHDPPHVHLGSNDRPRVSTKDFRPLSDKDATKMTDKQRKFCSSLSDEAKDLIRQRQQQIFRYGRLTPVKPSGFISPVVVEEMTPWGFLLWSLFHSDPSY